MLKCLGSTALFQGAAEVAASLFQQSLAMYRSFGDKRGTAMVLGALGELAVRTQHDSRAAQHLEEYLELSRALKDIVHTARALCSLARLAERQADYPRAHVYLREALALFQGGGYDAEVRALVDRFAELAIAEQQLERAALLRTLSREAVFAFLLHSA